MEHFDILDRHGNPTGLTAPKGSPLAPGQYYLGTHVYVYNLALQFLIQQRAYDKKFLPGGWDVHLEHAIAGETSVQCVARGLKEEIGIIAPEDSFRPVYRLVWEEHNHIVDVCFLQVEFDISKLAVPNNEVIAVKAINKAEMLEMVSKMHWRPDEYRQSIRDAMDKLT